MTATGCATAQAARVADGPPLDVPAPPERVLAPVEDVAVATTPAPVTTPEPAATTPPTRPAPPRPTPQPPAAAATPPAPAPPTDNRVLTTTAGNEREVRDLLARANQNLSRVNRTRLSRDGQANYDQARRFAQQAEQALRERNVAFAATLADKAATLAAELAPR